MAGANWGVVGAVALAAFAGGLFLGKAIGPGEREAGSAVASAPASPAGARAPFREPRSESAPRAVVAAPEGFAYQRVVYDMAASEPRACFQFSAALQSATPDAGEAVDYADYVTVEGGQKPVVEVAGSQLCLTGLQFVKDYNVTLRQGLPAADGSKLARSQSVTVAFGDKPAFVGFSGDGVILPRADADGFGIETVNVDKVKITVRRVGDRILARKAITEGEATPEDGWGWTPSNEDGEDVGVVVYEGKLDIKGARNDTTTTVFPLGAALKTMKAGAYFVSLEDASETVPDNVRRANAWRWLVYTDMALTAYRGADGLDVVVRSISTARPVAGANVTLVAQNNEKLGEGITDGDGRLRFPGALTRGEGALRPRMVMAYGAQDDFAALDLQRAPLDLSDRNVGGRKAEGPVDAFVWFDRGIYRPGETVHLNALMRDNMGKALTDRPATIVIRRPNGTQAARMRVDKMVLGGVIQTYDVPKSAPRGVWRVEVTADGADTAGRGEFSVEDFVPQRLEVKLEGDETTPLTPNQSRPLTVRARFLYGAPGAGLPVESEARVRVDPNPFPEFKAYRFGPAEGGFDEQFVSLGKTATDGEGVATVPLDLGPLNAAAGLPLRADVTVGVSEPGGRVVRESARVPVRLDDRYVGVRLSDESDGRVGAGQDAKFDVVLLDPDGARVGANAVAWKLVEEDYRFEWYRQDGEWRWRRSYRDVAVDEGRVDVPADRAGQISKKLDYGTYRLIVTHPQSGAQTEYRFYVGWRSYAAGAQSPDQAALSGPDKPVAPGSRTKVYLKPPYAGEAVITVASDRVLSVQRMHVDADGREISIDTDPSWGAGFYVMATVVTPRDPQNRPIPRRAMGIAYVPFDMSARTLKVSFDANEVVRPRQTYDAALTISGERAGQEAHLTLAAVDEGVLRLTKFKTPDPADWYYGKKRLGVDVYDDYGRMLDPNLGAPAKFGGDQLGGEGLTVVPTKTVALFSGVVTVGRGGKVSVPIQIPDFNGELRLMAVAWSADKVGGGGASLTVRDPVPAELAFPRFLSPGDTASTTLSLDNVEGAAGDYVVSVSGEGPVEVSQTQTFTLAKGERTTAEFPINAEAAGIGAVNLSVKGPGGFEVSRSYPIQVRPAFYPVTEVRVAQQKPGETFKLSSSVLAGFIPGTGEASVSYSPIAGVDPGPLVDALWRYPYGCTEQTVSTAMPLVLSKAVRSLAGRKEDFEARARVQEAINKVLDRQSSDGAFGLWQVGDGAATPWLGAYVTDFLYRAKEAGYAVPQYALDKAYEALSEVARVDRWASVSYDMSVYEGPWTTDSTKLMRRRSAAYADYVLARAGRADLSDLRYFHDTFLDATPSPLARAQLAVALGRMGDTARYEHAMKAAEAALGYDNTGNWYQTPLRDAAGMLALAAEAGDAKRVEKFTEAMRSRMKDPKDMQTQEKAFVVLAADALLKQAGPARIAVNGSVPSGLTAAPAFSPAPGELAQGVSYENRSTGPLFRSLTVTGAPKKAPEPAEQGFTLTKRIATRDGQAADLSKARQNDRFIVVISGKPQDKRNHPAVIADLLPAGFEIESVLRPEDGGGNTYSGPYAWIGDISYPKIAEARDDRFVAAIDVRDSRFTLAYVVRAVTPGTFVMPGAVVEDMYRPGVFARTAASSLTVAAAK